MEKENIKTVEIKDFQEAKHLVDYVDDDFVIINSLEAGPYQNEMVRMNCFLIIFCMEGCIQEDLNYKTYQLNSGDVLFVLPNSVLGHTMLAPKYKVKLVGFSSRFLQYVIRMDKTSWETTLYIRNNPIKHVGVASEKDEKAAKIVRDLIMSKICDKDPHCYHKDVVQHLFAALFCDLMGYFSREASKAGAASELLKESDKRSFYISRKFTEMLTKDNGIHRSVSYYADALCYSPKHFSKVIKQACGRTPLDMINEHAMEHIKYRLKYSDKSIKEIAEEFEFPNQSFFGKYVKAHLGMSPARYRNNKDI